MLGIHDEPQPTLPPRDRRKHDGIHVNAVGAQTSGEPRALGFVPDVRPSPACPLSFSWYLRSPRGLTHRLGTKISLSSREQLRCEERHADGAEQQ